jgi:hypothetical protein
MGAKISEIPSPLWGGVRGGGPSACAVVDGFAVGFGDQSLTTARCRPDPHPLPLPTRGRGFWLVWR